MFEQCPHCQFEREDVERPAPNEETPFCYDCMRHYHKPPWFRLRAWLADKISPYDGRPL